MSQHECYVSNYDAIWKHDLYVATKYATSQLKAPNLANTTNLAITRKQKLKTIFFIETVKGQLDFLHMVADYTLRFSVSHTLKHDHYLVSILGFHYTAIQLKASAASDNAVPPLNCSNSTPNSSLTL